MTKRILLIVTILILAFSSGYGQTKYFGKNKVQYREYDWKYIKTNYFDIYFYDDSKYLAEFAASIAEDALNSIQSTLDYRINKRIPLMVYKSHNEFQQNNVINQYMSEGIGGVTELYKNRILIPFQGDYEVFRHVIHHELVHAVMNDMFYGGTVQSAISSGNMINMPIWIAEGMAEFESHHGYNIETDMFMRDLALSDQLRDLNRLSNYYAYRGGQAFYWFIAEKYGRKKIGDLLNNMKSSRSLDMAFKRTFHMDVEEFSSKWKNFLKKYYLPDIAKFENPEDYATRLTNYEKDETYYNTSPAISPDGNKMAYISAPNGVFGVYVRSIDDKEDIEEIASSNREQDFEDLNMITPGISWSPDSKSLAISAKYRGQDALYIVDVESKDYQIKTFDMGTLSSVRWSPDGKYIAFSGAYAEMMDIFIYDIDNDKLENATEDVFTDRMPTWSHDSKILYFISDRGNNLSGSENINNFKMWKHDYSHTDIFSIDLASKHISRITNTPEYSKTDLATSADGAKLLYTSDANGILNIYEIMISNGSTRPITNSLTGITQISLAEDASRLIFCTQVDGGYDLFMIRRPFEKRIPGDTLAKTKYRVDLFEALNIASTAQIDTDQDDNSGNLSYGNFKVDFSRQQIVQPNPDAKHDINFNQDPDDSKVDDDPDYPVHDYKISFTPDLIYANPTYSTFWGAMGMTQMMFSDVSGDHKIFGQAYLLSDLKNSILGFTYYYQPKVIDYGFSVYHNALNYYQTSDIDTISGYYSRFRDFGAVLFAQYSFDRFNRIEWGVAFKQLEMQNFNPDLTKAGSQSRSLLIPQARYVHDDVVWGMLAPVKGSRYDFEIIGVPKLSSGGIGFMTMTGDFRHYIQLSGLYGFAIRANAGLSLGPDPVSFFLGGTDNWIGATLSDDQLPFENPEDFAFMNLVMPLRGWYINEVSGNRFFLTNIEFRFPMLGAFLAGPLPIFQSFMGSVFMDIGGAWTGGIESFRISRYDEDMGKRLHDNLLMSTGLGVRTVILGIPVKLDIAWRNEYYRWSPPEYMVSLGLDF